MIGDNLNLPFDTELLGVPVTVERIDLTEADEIVAISSWRFMAPCILLPA